MATADEKKAMAFLLAVALVGAGVRWVGVQRFESDLSRQVDRSAPAAGAARALAAQLAAIDSLRAVPRKSRTRPKSSKSAKSAKSATASSAAAKPPRQATGPPERIDVNSATAAELERLPRVGPALAQRIVDYRQRQGPFQAPEDLRHVRGIGPSTVRLLEPLVTFSGRHRP
jgi:competence protein ComEA